MAPCTLSQVPVLGSRGTRRLTVCAREPHRGAVWYPRTTHKGTLMRQAAMKSQVGPDQQRRHWQAPVTRGPDWFVATEAAEEDQQDQGKEGQTPVPQGVDRPTTSQTRVMREQTSKSQGQGQVLKEEKKISFGGRSRTHCRQATHV